MIILKSVSEIQKIGNACKIVGQVLNKLESLICPGISTFELDQIAEKLIRDNGAEPAFKGYRGYPATLCTSINDEIVHGIPTRQKKLIAGDIISIDVGVYLEGYYGDAAITVAVDDVSSLKKKLLEVTKESLHRGIKQALEGNRLYDISFSIQEYVESNGFSVVKDYVGHGIGRSLHEDPQIPNFGNKGHGCKIKAGMVFAIEPMVNAGSCGTRIKDDKWTAVTVDGNPSAHFEHTVAITDNGPVILTAA